MHTEQQSIQRIARYLPCAPGAERVPIGLGDDAAAIALSRGANIVVSCDAFIEGTHFLADGPADSAGYKALVRAASDLAAMGARPEFFLLSLALPNAHTGRWLSGFLHGMGRAARQLKMSVIGGDTTRGRIIAVNVTVLGEAAFGDLVTRSGARPGDGIYVSGRLGGAKLALELIRRGLGNRRRFGRILRPYLYPTIRGQLGEWLGQNHVASAMMDISDGISTDLARLCLASGVGARVWGESIPCVEISPRIA